MKNNEQTYAKATARLNHIMQQLEQEELDIDSLADTLTEAKRLISFCKQRLTEVDKSVREILDEESEEAKSKK